MTEAAPRQCGSCNACCKTHSVDESDLVKPAGVWCKHAVPGKGCSIYPSRPIACKAFRCGWLKGIGKDEHRPDKTRVVLDPVVHPRLPGGTAMQMWEVSEGALLSKYAQDITAKLRRGGIRVHHIRLGGKVEAIS